MERVSAPSENPGGGGLVAIRLAGGANDSSQLETAAMNGDLERVKLEIEVEKVAYRGTLALHWAALNGQCVIAKYLLEQGCDVNALGGEKCSSPLYWAASRGQLQMVMLLLASGADVKIGDVNGLTPLHLVSCSNFWQITAYLVARGQDIDERDAHGMTPLMWACSSSMDGATTRFLIRYGGALHTTDRFHGNTPLHFAIGAGNKFAVEQLLRAGAPLDIANASGQTPVDLALRKENASTAVAFMVKQAWQCQDNRLNAVLRRLHHDPFRMRQHLLLAMTVACVALWMCTFYLDNWLETCLAFSAVSYCYMNLGKRITIRHRKFRDPIPYGVYMSTKVWLFFTWFFIFWPYVRYSWIMLPFTLNTVLLCYHHYKAVASNPGYLPPDLNIARQWLRDVIEHGQTDSQFCMTCFLKKPLRSKHCSTCDTCVSRFDHHCPFVLNCVGEANHRHFVLFLFYLTIMNLIYMYGAVQFYLHTFHFVPGQPFVRVVVQFIACSRWVFSVSALSIVFTMWVVGLLASQLCQIANGYSTNEMINRRRYTHFQLKNGRFESPFDRGIIQNLVNFFAVPVLGWLKVEPWDWSREFSLQKHTDVGRLLECHPTDVTVKNSTSSPQVASAGYQAPRPGTKKAPNEYQHSSSSVGPVIAL